MKKINLIIILFLIWSSYGMTWGVLDFEDGTFTGTSMLDVDGDTNNWEILPSAKNGSYVVRSESGSLTPDNWLISSRMLEVERYSSTVYPHVKLMVAGNDSVNFAEKFQVVVSFTDNLQESFFVVHEEILTSAEWKEIDIDLMPFFSQYQWTADMYVGVRHFDSAGQSALLFDDLMVYTKPSFNYEGQYSAIVEGPIVPYSDFDLRWDIYDRTAYDKDWELTNDYGSVQLHYIITDENGPQDELAIDIFPSTDLNFDWCYDVTVTGRPMGTFIEYWLIVVDGSGYGVYAESEHFNVEWGEINFEEGFEYGSAPPEGWLPEGWITFQTGDDQGSSFDKPWMVDVSMQNIHNGDYSISSVSQNNFGVYETENYLVSPRTRINGESSLKYFVNAQTPEGYVEKWSVLVSTVDGDGTDIENFTEIMSDSIVAGSSDDEWFERTIFLEDYTEQYVRIMWKHHYTSLYKLERYLNIDDICIANVPVIEVVDAGIAALPYEDAIVNITATDYSGINNITIYYTVKGEDEVALVMTDNGDDTFTGLIPGQALDASCTWYAIATDNSVSANTTTSDTYDIIWFVENWLEWGTTPGVYPDAPYGNSSQWIAAMDWNFGSKADLYLNKISVGFDSDETVTWKLVEFDGVPTDNVVGTLEGVANFTAGGTEIVIDPNNTKISGHVALCLYVDGGFIDSDYSGDETHTWQYTESQGWKNNSNGAFHIRMYVSNNSNSILISTPNGGEVLSQNTEYEIKWLDNLSENVKIELYQDSLYHSDIISSTPSDSSYFWITPESLTGENFKIKISSTLDQNLYDFSDNHFTISAGSINITSPSDGDILEMYEQYAIEWTDDISEDVDVILYKDSTVVINYIISSTGIYDWLVHTDSLVAGVDYTLKIVSVDDSNIFDETGYFTIKGTNNVNGSVSDIWTEQNSPYILSDSTYVELGNSLTIEPNIKVVGIPENKGLNIFGKIKVLGEYGNEVNFKEIDINFDNNSSTDSSKILYTIFGNKELEGKNSKSYNDQTIRIKNNSKVIIQNCQVINVENYGIIVEDASPVISNSLITGNLCGIKLTDSSPQYIINNTISNNDSIGIYFDGNSDGMFINNIIYGNVINQIYLNDDNSDPEFYYNNIQGGRSSFGLNSGVTYTGYYTSNIDQNPLFSTGSYELQEISECVDSGYPDLTYEFLEYLYIPSKDLAGNLRLNGEIDMGAYEYYFPVITPDSPTNILVSVVTVDSISTLTLDWDNIPIANSYIVYSSNNPYGDFEYLSTVYTNTWDVIIDVETKKFYHIIACSDEVKSNEHTKPATSKKLKIQKIENLINRRLR